MILRDDRREIDRLGRAIPVVTGVVAFVFWEGVGDLPTRVVASVAAALAGLVCARVIAR